ncbi:MAG: acetyl-CoA carboxylase biotin carboxylase subunit [Desulfomonile tiedjei]|nr:acetyl-CoA carboxylase biotin carboxylase subunit [Desulfomonile tiedjei]
MFKKILVANRGEIAVRIMRTCKRMGIRTVAVYSEVDFRSPFVREADEAAMIGPAPSRESYLNQEKIVSVARDYGCDAVHPGYGFLSENARFAEKVRRAGLCFVGPPASSIATLGDKIASKTLAIKAGVPVVPGHHEPLKDPEEAAGLAKTIGFPLLLKPAAGGGGRGMRIVRGPDELLDALAACREETRKSFGDDRIFIERYIERPRHIEVQIMADSHGNVIHLGERECSVQRRYQKVVEETPSMAVDPSLRDQMGSVACALAREVGYTNAGTVEFIMDPEKNFYFLEMNTRLQVEHPVTEMVTSLDLVELQIRVAAGEPLPLKQEDVTITGWAIEARICAEDPTRGFVPTTGIITRYAMPRGKGIRVDSGIEAGSVVSIYYDSLLAKVIAFGEDREEARQTLMRGLNGYHIEGLTTNVDFVNAILDHPAFVQGDLSTDFIEEHFESGHSKAPARIENLHYMTMGAVLIYHTRENLVRESLKPMAAVVGGAHLPRESHEYVVRMDEGVFTVTLHGDQATRKWQIEVNGATYEVITPEFEYYRRRLKLTINGSRHMFRFRYQDDHIRGFFCGIVRTFEVYTPREWNLVKYMPEKKQAVQQNVLKCPMPGLVVAVCVEEGAYIHRGDELVRMESMKMESGIASPRDGYVEKILVKPGQTVETDDTLLTFADSWREDE